VKNFTFQESRPNIGELTPKNSDVQELDFIVKTKSNEVTPKVVMNVTGP